jgi:DNA repair photolyase
MIQIPAKTAYIDPDISARPNCKRRLDGVLPHVACADVRELAPGDLKRVFDIGKRRHGKDDFGDDAVLVFTTFDEARRGWFYHWRDEAGRHGGHCQPALELNIVDGCVFRCAYCGFGRRIIFYLDLERLIDGLDGIFDRHPEQRLYKYSNMTDLPPFEPELDMVRPMVQRFSREPGRFLMLFTKSDNVEFLTDIEHCGHTIISWSLTCDTASRLVDKRAATMQQRIGAMARMQQAGYPVRARLSPIVPVANWREEYASLFEELFSHVKPDLITLELLGWMTVDDLLAMFSPSFLDADALRQAEAAREQLADVHWGPYTQQTHEDIYSFCIDTVQRLSPQTPVSVCHGTTATWEALGSKMQMTPGNYICNCGPLSTPRGALYEKWNPGNAQPSHRGDA